MQETTPESTEGRPDEHELEKVKKQLKGMEVVAMLFNWISYEEMSFKVADWLVGQKFSEEEGYPQLKDFGEWVVTSEYLRDEKHDHIHAFICHSAQRKQAVVSFRGTELNIMERWEQTLHDWMHGCFDTKLVNWRTDEDCGKVHSGFLKHYKAVSESLQQHLVPIFKRGYTVVFTGHSQGGALATLAMLEAAERNLEHKYQMHLMTFGAPNLADQEFIKYFRMFFSPSHVTHYIASYPNPYEIRDFVTTVPPTSFGYYQIEGAKKFVRAHRQSFGNPNPIKNVEYQGPATLPRHIGCHYQQTYMDGLLHPEGISDQPFLITVKEKASMKTQEAVETVKQVQNKIFQVYDGWASAFSKNK